MQGAGGPAAGSSPGIAWARSHIQIFMRRPTDALTPSGTLEGGPTSRAAAPLRGPRGRATTGGRGPARRPRKGAYHGPQPGSPAPECFSGNPTRPGGGQGGRAGCWGRRSGAV